MSRWVTWLRRRVGTDARPAAAAEGTVTTADPIGATANDAAEDALAQGNAHVDRGDLAAAERCYRAAAALIPGWAPARINLGYVLYEVGRAAEALGELAQAVRLAPENADAHYLLGAALLQVGDAAGAVAPLSRAVALQPSLAPAHRDLGKALFDAGRIEEAERALRLGLEAAPGHADTALFLGNVYAETERFERALEAYRAALALRPDLAVVHANMVPALIHACDFAGAVQAADRALALDPSSLHARSNLLMALSRDPACSPQRYLAHARAYGEAVLATVGRETAGAAPARGRDASLSARATGPTGDDGARPLLRVGVVSGDLRRHPVGYFLETVLAQWDHARMPIEAFANQRAGDAVTARLQRHFDAWHDISRTGDAEVCKLIERRRIDVLIDLSGHTPQHRLPVFARRAAPVQVSWLGYWASTGVQAMDYLLADPTSVPEAHVGDFTETVRWLPGTRLCFSPPEHAPDVAPLPALTRGHLTFGSFQSMVKLNRPVLDLWGRVLAAVPHARLRLQALQFGDPRSLQAMRERLDAAGIDPARVDLRPPTSREAYLAAHAEVDVILDTFPHTGGTTTCEALWMGVPTLTIAGCSMLARQGASLLAAAGLPDWIAVDEADFVDRAVQRCADLQALQSLRHALRGRVSGSALFDAVRFGGALQNALESMHLEKAPRDDPGAAPLPHRSLSPART